MLRRRSLAVALFVPALGLGACTQADKNSSTNFKGDQKAVAAAVEDLSEAGRKGDSNRICEQLLARDLVRTIEQASDGRCAKVVDEALQDADAFDMSVEKVDVSGTTATATVKSETGKNDRTDQLRLVRDGRNWKIAALGSD
jgi:hypothetical protein